ncbi:hypothetical protein COT63_02445 [Candidatus Shapirobacteria bacterium CG09_land_8_20_14_0_10_38_17]|uniref:VTT domain-containing protein n=1 Tax=Candidatus Shapirobacteria bacterium CG09_land_8_20_14_0_10_38_17 TaxID=1974884 RepID=A0A2H0WQQ4_9BACT|nr:MAG: hypothetical protein COT63_02445 [Candidatus Shapirobacteria bacterium CG09_land_8_20_14_0_10_38_17]
MFEVINNLTTWLLASIGKNGPLAIFLGGLIEQVIIPIPSPLITMAGGFLLIPQNIPFEQVLKEALLKVVLPYTIAASLGLGIVYFIAYFGGKPLIEKFHHYLGFSWQDIKQLQKKFRGTKKDGLLIIALRAIPVIPISVISGVCGAIRFPIPEFYIASIVGVFIRSFILTLIGWQTGEAYQAIARGLDKIESLITVAILGIIVLVLIFGYKRREKFLRGGKKISNH